MMPFGNIRLPAQTITQTQCRIIIGEPLWHSHEISSTMSAQATILYEFENYISKIVARTPRGQRVKALAF